MTQTLSAPGRSPGSFPLPRFIPFLLLLLAACAGPSPSGEADISVALQAVTTSDVSKVTLTVSASDMSSSVVRDLQNVGGGTFKAILGGLPAGTNRTFLAQAFNASSVKIYEGQATGVTVTPGGTVSVVILLQQSTPPTPFVNTAPRLTGLTTSSSQVKPGQAITLTATATDADGDALTYAWTAAGGTFSNNAVASPTWTAPSAEGTYNLSVSVSDSRGGQAGVSLKISVVGDRGSANVSVVFNAWPVVSQVTGTPFGQVAPGGVVKMDVTVVEPDGDALTYSWADDCGGSFNGTGVKTLDWTAPAAAPTGGVCKVTVTVRDGRGGSTTGRLGIGVGLPTAFNVSPIIDQTFQSNNLFLPGDKVNLNVDAHDPEGTAVSFTWSASGGTLGTPTTSGTHSAVVWTAPSQVNTYTITVVVQDAAGQKTTQSFTVDSVLQNCVKVVTSFLNEVNPYSSPLTVAYSMVGGGGGSAGISAGSSGSKASGTFTLGSGYLTVVVGGGGGYGNYWNGGLGGGGAGYYGGGSGGNAYNGGGSGGGGGSSVIATSDLLVDVAAGGSASESFGGGGGSTTGGTAGFNAPGYNNNPTAGAPDTGGHNKFSEGGDGPVGGGSTRSDSGGGGGYGGGGGGPTASGTPGGAGGTWGDNGGGTTGGLGANTWSAATTLPTEAGGVNINGGGNAGLVILTYTAASCRL